MRVYDCGNSLILTNTDRFSGGSGIKKLDADHYLDSDGFICEFNHADNKGGCVQSVRRAFGRMKAIINCNYDKPSEVGFLTLTYAENMQDNWKLSCDVRNFFKKLKKHGFPHFEYLYVREQQERGAWHVHIIMFFGSPAPVLHENFFNDVWRKGFTDYRVMDDSLNNLGMYLSACLTQHGPKDKKARRLFNYDTGLHLYSCSKGIQRPIEYVLRNDSEVQAFLDARGAVFRSKREYEVFVDTDKSVSVSKSLYTCNPL